MHYLNNKIVIRENALKGNSLQQISCNELPSRAFSKISATSLRWCQLVNKKIK